MGITLAIVSALLILVSVLPFVPHTHWVFRVAEFVKLQVLVLQVVVLTLTFFFVGEHYYLWYFQVAQIVLIVYHIWVVAPYSRLWTQTKVDESERHSEIVKFIICNVYQYNSEYHRFVNLIHQESPDLFFTMESNRDWEKAMRPLEKEYPNYQKVTLENTYGMHLYTRLKVRRIQTHYFVADDVPSIEAELETPDGQPFVFFGVHPPPPSPTEEENSKERDGDILSVAKKVKDYSLPTIVAGDFNNVAWAKSSVLFRKVSGLIDARIGRKILPTFHTRYKLLRAPLDLLYHSPDIVIDQLLRHPSVGSDHFPVGCSFFLNKNNPVEKEDIQDVDQETKEEVDNMIEEGKDEKSENRQGD